MTISSSSDMNAGLSPLQATTQTQTSRLLLDLITHGSQAHY